MTQESHVPIDVLLVEDDPADELITREAFEHNKIGNTLHVVRDGEEALDFLYRRAKHADAVRPDLILLDLNLGRFSIDGWEVNRRLKADPLTRTIPVIALTAHAQRVEHRERSLAEGFVQHISKPFDYDTLIDQVRAHSFKEGVK